MKPATGNGSALGGASAADRDPRPVDHLVLGQRSRDNLSRPDARAVPARPRGAVPRARQAVVPRAPRPDRLAVRRPCASTGCRGVARALGRRGARRRSGDRRLVRAGRYRGRRAGCARSRRGIVAFYDIDTPVTLAALADGTLRLPRRRADPRVSTCTCRSPAARRCACSRRASARRRRGRCIARVDPERHRPAPAESRRGGSSAISAPTAPIVSRRWTRCCCEPARRWPEARFAVAGPLYPAGLRGPPMSSASSMSRPDAASRFYGAAALHAECHPRRHGPPRLFAERAAVRGGGVRRADHQRLVAGSRRRSSSPGAKS